MKKSCCLATLCALFICLLICGCEETPISSDIPTVPSSTSSIKTDDSVWYSEGANVRGRIWLGMTEKEVYDVLTQYNIPIKKIFGNSPELEYDEYDALCLSSQYYKKQLYTKGHQHFFFDEEDRLVEIGYYDQMHPDDDPVNEEFKTQGGVNRGNFYQDMIVTYGEPDKVIDLDKIHQSYMYQLENGDYLHFVFQNNYDHIQAIHYCEYPYLFSY